MQKKLEEAEEIKRELNLTLEATTEGLWKWNFLSNEMEFSPGYYRMLGFEPDEFAPSFDKWKERIHPDDQEKALQTAMEWLQNKEGEYRNRFRLKKKNGEDVFVIAQGRVVEYDEEGNAVRMIGSHIDITELVEAQEKLRLAEERLNLAAEGTRDGLWDWDLKTNKAFYSDQFARQLGYEPGELPYTSDAWSNLLHPEDKDEAFKAVEDYLKSDKPTYESIFRMRKKDGRYIWISGRGKAVYDDEENPVRFVGFNTDITELVEARHQAEESDRLKTAFLANMSHEIRTPLNGIVGFAQLLTKEDTSRKDINEYAEIIKSCSRDLLKIINNIIDIAKIEAGQISYKPQSLPLNAILREVFLLYKSIAEQQNLLLTLDCPEPDSFHIEADELHLKQILVNLVGNAVKFTREGSIEIGYKVKNEWVEFYVNDTGPGVPEDKVEIIFHRFRQAGGERPGAVARGTGLGLSISKTYVELAGGYISCFPREPQGSRFVFTLPNRQEQTKTSSSVTRESSIPGKARKTVLVVEDESINYLYIQKLLIDYGFSPLHAIDAESTLSLIHQIPDINLILMDIKIPDGDGYSLTKKIREIKPDIPIIAQTAYAIMDQSAAEKSKMFQDYLTKPFSAEQLSKILEKWLPK